MNIIRKRIAFFAKWARITTPFTREKHYIENDKIIYDVVNGQEYSNHIEMAGNYCASIISYGADKNSNLKLMRHAVYPTLRLYPNKTHNSLDNNFKNYSIKVNGCVQKEKVEKFIFDGVLKIKTASESIAITRELFPAMTKLALCEIVTIKNTTDAEIEVILNAPKDKKTLGIFGHNNQKYQLSTVIDYKKFSLKATESKQVSIYYYACLVGDNVAVDCVSELQQRNAMLDELKDKLVIKTPDSKINLMSYYAKVRSAESIFMTKSGLMHSPGGGGYYAAIWTNDQCEYVNPLFAYLGYKKAIDQSINCYNLYKKYISKDKALITSIIAEGDGIWHGAKDRGDSAMYAYGCSRFLLTLGDIDLAKDFINYIDSTIEYTLSRKNEYGIIMSDSDELENRFISGNANLCTSTLTYDALLSTSYLHRDLNNIKKAEYYMKEANELAKNIDKYFGKDVEGYKTYMYCLEESKLRSWIAMPLVVGIFDRKEQTKEALLSNKLRVREGLVTRSGEKTFWDRSTLYSLRGLFNAGFADESLELLSTYTSSRLLGEHIPYAVEAFPEGNQAQLSAESGLYLRIITEGILGIRPTGLGKFVINCNLPTAWDNLQVNNIYLANQQVSISIERKDDEYLINIVTPTSSYNVKRGEEICLQI